MLLGPFVGAAIGEFDCRARSAQRPGKVGLAAWLGLVAGMAKSPSASPCWVFYWLISGTDSMNQSRHQLEMTVADDAGHGQLRRQCTRRHHSQTAGSGGLCLRQPRAPALLRDAVGGSGNVPATDPTSASWSRFSPQSTTPAPPRWKSASRSYRKHQQQVVRHTNSCCFTMVAMGDDGKPAKCRCCSQPTRRTPALRRRQAAQTIAAGIGTALSGNQVFAAGGISR